MHGGGYVMEQVLNDLWLYLYALMYTPFYDIYHLGHHLWSATIGKYHKSFALIWIWTMTLSSACPQESCFVIHLCESFWIWVHSSESNTNGVARLGEHDV